MKKNPHSINGFIVKRPESRPVRPIINDQKNVHTHVSEKKPIAAKVEDKALSLGQPRVGVNMDYFGNHIEEFDIPVKKTSRRQQKKMDRRTGKKPRNLFLATVRFVFTLVLIAGLLIGAYAAYKFISAGNSIFQGNILNIFNKQPLKEDQNGRSNFLIFGTSEDDPGHDASYLTDSMMIVSVNQEKKDVYVFSIPRDLVVDYGMACLEGYRGKINSYYNCVNEVADDTESDAKIAEQERLLEMQKLVGSVYGIDIQYTAHVNYTVLKDVVDAVGGIDVYIEGSMGEPGILDRNADWRCDYKCYYVKYDNGTHHLDGEHALYLALARGHEPTEDNRFSPTYGLSRSNPDREANQQKILVAIKDKALSNGLLSNVGSVSSLIDSLGGNLRTNIQMNEVGTILQVAKEIDTNNMIRVDLIEAGVMNGNGNPSAGDFNYKNLQEYIKKTLSSDLVAREAAPIVVLNGTSQIGLGQTEADKLTEAGFTIASVGNAPKNTYTTTEIYQIGEDNNATASKLASVFGATIKKTAPPTTVNGNVRFVVIIGRPIEE